MTRIPRTHAEARARMREGILRLGNAQLAEVGAASLSVREIARGLGVSSSAIYRHVANRDELLTLLLVDAFTDLASATLGGDDPTALPRERLAGLSHRMREWAVAHPERWALAYGSPVPGYAAPAEQTTGPGTRVMALFLEVMAQGSRPGGFPGRVSPELASELEAGVADLGISADIPIGAAAAAAVEAWTGLIGLISAEVFGQLGPDLARHGRELLQHWVAATADRFDLG